MSDFRAVPYGSWPSPIKAAQIAAGAVRLSQIEVDGGDIYWKELRPVEGGRCVVVRRSPDGATADMVPPPFNVRSRVHEYGGGAYLADGGAVIFSNFADQRLYRVSGLDAPVPITPDAAMRYADGVPDRRRGRYIFVREDHTRADREAVNEIVAVYADEEIPDVVLVSGNDFFSSPRLSPDGSTLAWLAWNHPDMPWDAAALYAAAVTADGTLGEATRVAGGSTEAVVQPEWSPDGVLYFVSDRSNWWNLCRRVDGTVEPVVEMAAEFARAHWVFRMSTYGFADSDRIVCATCRNGTWSLGVVDLDSCELHRIDGPFTEIDDVCVAGRHACFIGASAESGPAVIRLDPATGEWETLRRASDLAIDPGCISKPQPVEFSTENGLTAHGIFYAPTHTDCAAPTHEKPPLLVMSHGGPTSATSASLSLKVQYYTSRGIAVLDVNYGGSTGYGREYRERLYGQWGVVDVDDCCNGARHVAERGLVDPKRLAITGGSAGGYTTLSCLAFRDVFAAGSSHFGVSDCEALALETHKFESRYLDKLIGPYPEQRDVYRARSPIHHTDKLSCPVIFFQGTEDRIVPPNQAETMAASMREKGIPVALLMFEGEQHGFRRAENIARALEAELYFLGRVFGFTPADDIEPVRIDNLT